MQVKLNNKDIKKEKDIKEVNSVKNVKAEIRIDIEEISKAGLHFGHRKCYRHPKMKPYIFTTRGDISIIDLVKTAKMFEEALKFITELSSKNKIILFIGTKVQAKDLVKKTAQECGMPYINERWLGGTFTNFEVILKRINHLKEFEKKKQQGEFEKYPKKERLKLDKIYNKLKLKFEGIKNLKQLPDAIFVLDIFKDRLAVKEARKMGIKVIAITDTNTNPNLADYPIPANDDALSSIRYILEKVKQVIVNAKKN